MRKGRCVAAALLAVLAIGPLRAQDSTAATTARQMEVWGGLAQNSPRWGALGETPGMNLAMVALRISVPLSDPDASRFTTYHVDVVPLAVISPSYESAQGDPRVSCRPGVLCVFPRELERGLFPRGSVIGAGVSPLGLTTHFRHDRRVSPSLGMTAGAMFFDRPTPTTRAGRFNFTAAIELALRFRRAEGNEVVLTYRLHHISNARTAAENPGVASHLLSFGLRPRWRP